MQKFSPKKILVINIFGIGDVLFTTPLLANLKRAFPQTQIGYLCNRRSSVVLEHNPRIDKTFFYDRDEFAAASKQSKFGYLKKLKSFWGEIKEERYDCVIDVSLSSFTSFFCFFIGIPKRIGFNFKNRSPYLTDKITLKGYEGRHVIEYYLDLLSYIGVEPKHKELELYLDKEDEEFAQSFLKSHGLDNKSNLIGLVVGGGASWGKDADYKRWGADNYAKLADKLIEKFSCEVILFGDKLETSLCQNVVEKMVKKPILACGETTVKQMAALAKRMRLMVVNDGGPLHICVAAQAKTVSIFGPVDERVYGPYPSEGHAVVTKQISCRPCYHKFKRASCSHVSCLKTLMVDDVFHTIKEALT